MSEQEGFKVVVTGFKTQAEADMFIEWYLGTYPIDHMTTDKFQKVSKWQGNQRELPLDLEMGY